MKGVRKHFLSKAYIRIAYSPFLFLINKNKIVSDVHTTHNRITSLLGGSEIICPEMKKLYAKYKGC